MRAREIARSFRGRIFAVILAATLGGLWSWQVLRHRDLATDEAERLVTSLVRAAEYQIGGTMRSIEALLDEATNRIDPPLWPAARLEEWFSARLGGFPDLRALVVLDAGGRVRGEPMLAPGRALMGLGDDLSAAGDFYQKLTDDARAQSLVIGTPVRLADGTAYLPVARAVADHAGHFAGAVVAIIDPAVWRDRLSALAAEEAGGTALFREDAVFIARVPGHEQTLGRRVSDSPVFHDLLPQAPSGVGYFVGLADGLDKIVAYRRFARYPLVVVIGITRRTALAQWQEQCLQEGGILSLLVLAVLILATLFDHRAEANRRLLAELAASHDALEAQVEERTAHLAASNAELAQFAYIASHDLREPLRTVSSFLQLLARRYRGRLDAEADEYIAFAVNGAKRMSLLISDVLAFSQIGQVPAAMDRCDIENVLREVVEALKVSVEDAGGCIDIGSPLPSVQGVASQLHSLFQNLIGNAVKYRSPDRPLQVCVTAQALGEDWVHFTVADNGIGIESQYLDLIFRIFQRLHTQDRYEGTGIGLALCRKIVERHGGRIWADSTPDVGTAFHFTLPRASDSA